MCKALGWVGVGVKPIRACLCLWSQSRHHLLFQLLLKVFIVARAIFKRWNPGAAEDGAEDVLGF